MTIQTTRWSPDTCGCVIEFQWDDTVAPELRTHTHKSTIKACSAHTAQKDINTHFPTVLEENQRKNKCIYEMGKAAGVNMDLTQDSTEAEVKAFHSFVEKFNYSFDADRVLQVSHPTFNTTLAKTNLETTLKTNLSSTKIRVI